MRSLVSYRRVVAASIAWAATGAAYAHPGHGDVGHWIGQAHALEAIGLGVGLLVAAALLEKAVRIVVARLRRRPGRSGGDMPARV
jgi:hypothetical protein